MSSRLHKDLKQILHPYFFVLKEGREIGNDFLDYTLVMLHANCVEVIRTPKTPLSTLTIPDKTQACALSTLSSSEREASQPCR